VGYYTKRQEKKRPRKIYFSPKAVLIFRINNPSISAAMDSLTHIAAPGRFQKSKNLSGSTSTGEKKDKQQEYSNLSFLSKINRKRKHFYI